MIRLELEAEDITALRVTLTDFLAVLCPATAGAAPAPAPALQGEVLPPEPAKAPGRRGPKPKAPVEEVQAVDPVVPAADAPQLPSYEEVVNACKNLLGAKGMPALRELLKKFDVEQTKALKPEQYAEVIEKAEAATQA